MRSLRSPIGFTAACRDERARPLESDVRTSGGGDALGRVDRRTDLDCDQAASGQAPEVLKHRPGAADRERYDRRPLGRGRHERAVVERQQPSWRGEGKTARLSGRSPTLPARPPP